MYVSVLFPREPRPSPGATSAHKVAGSLIRGFPYTYRLKVSDIDYLQYNKYTVYNNVQGTTSSFICVIQCKSDIMPTFSRIVGSKITSTCLHS